MNGDNLFKIEKTALEDCNNNTELLQTGFWGKHKENFGWHPEAFRISRESHKSGDFLLLTLTRVFKGGFAFTYIPFGPQVQEPEKDIGSFLKNLAGALFPFLSIKPVFIRFDLPWGRRGKAVEVPVPKPEERFVKAPVNVQPASTVILPIDCSEDDILAAMKPKSRYNIRLSFKKGVTVIDAGTDGLKQWYDLYRETSVRDRIAIHSFEYYRSLLELAKNYGEGAPVIKLLLAEIDKEVLAGIIVAIKGEYAWYLYGASSNRKRNYMPSYALQWRAIRMAKENGCRYYDLFGIPPAPDAGHPMHGLYRFKTGFGGIILHRYGSYDIINRKFLYSVYRAGENVRRSYFKKIVKKILR